MENLDKADFREYRSRPILILADTLREVGFKFQRKFEKKSTHILELSILLASVKWLIPSLDELVLEVFEFDA